MNTLLSALYDLLCYITEDAVAHGLNKLPSGLNAKMNELANELGEYLDNQNLLDIERGD